MARPANGLDFWRGIALIMIFINHVPGMYLDRLTRRRKMGEDAEAAALAE